MKKLLLLLILSFFSAQGLAASCPDGSEPVKSVSADGTYFVYKCGNNNEQGSSTTSDSNDDWPSGKEYVYNCLRTGSCNVIIENLTEQPKLFIGKSYFDGSNKVTNIAYKGNHKPKVMTGLWGKKWTVDNYSPLVECQMGTCDNLRWSDYFDNMIYFQDPYAPNDGAEIIILNPKNIELGYPVNGGMYAPFRHAWDISHLLQSNNLENLKQGLIEGAEGKWLKELQAAMFIYRTNDGDSYEGFSGSLDAFLYPTVVPLIEAHIALQRNNMYSPEEFNLVHKWLEKRVWALEQGPLDGAIGSSKRKDWNWQLTHEAGNHETIWKKVAYMLWGIADKNETYFTAAVNGFEDFYGTMRSDGTFKGEHKKGDGANYGISSGNEVGQAMVVMSIILHNQGIDVRKKYPKIEKFVQWASKNYKNPKATGLVTDGTFSNSSLRFMSSNPMEKNTLGWMFLWDQVFETKYSKDYDFLEGQTRALVVFGIMAPKTIITTEVIHASEEESTKRYLSKFDKDLTFGTVNYGDYSSKSSDYYLEGDTSEKFTLRSVDCSKNDCNHNQRNIRKETEKDSLNLESKSLYEWSIYTPFDENDIYEDYQRYVFFESDCGNPITFGGDRGSYYVSFADYFTIDNDWIKIVEDYEMIEEWNTFELEVLWSAVPENGYFKLKHNNELLINYEGPTAKCDGVGFAYGLTRDNLDYENRVTKDSPTSIYYDNVKIYR